MIIGDLNLDWAEQDPDYLAEVKAFLVYGAQCERKLRLPQTGVERADETGRATTGPTPGPTFRRDGAGLEPRCGFIRE